MKLLALLLLVFGIPCAADDEVLNGPATAKCEATLITPEFRLRLDGEQDHFTYIRKLTREVHRRTKRYNLPVRPSFIHGVRNFEQVMFLLALGDAESVIPIVHNGAIDVDDSGRAMEKLAKEISELQTRRAAESGLDEKLESLERQFLSHAQIYADSYGFTKNVLELMESVAAGRGVPPNVGIANLQEESTDHEATLDLTTANAKTAAKSVLEIVWKWNHLPSAAQMKHTWTNNPYLLRAKLERDVKELKGLRRIDRVAVNFLAWLATTSTDMLSFIPERYRQIVLHLSGMQVDEFMKQLYMGKIQRLVHVTRRRTADGKLVMIKDPVTLHKLAEATKELAGASWANDLLLTYARLGYFNPYWRQLKGLVEDLAQTDPSFKSLAWRMEDAQRSAQDAGNIVYVYDRSRYQEAQFLIAQTIYLLAGEEGFRRLVMPWVERLLF